MIAEPRARSRIGRHPDDETLIRRLYAEHGRMLLAYATRLTGDRGAAEDLVQETLIRAWRHSDTVAGATAPLKGWLLTIVRNLAHDIAVMYRGKIVEAGPADRILENPEHEYTRALIDAIPIPVVS